MMAARSMPQPQQHQMAVPTRRELKNKARSAESADSADHTSPTNEEDKTQTQPTITPYSGFPAAKQTQTLSDRRADNDVADVVVHSELNEQPIQANYYHHQQPDAVQLQIEQERQPRRMVSKNTRIKQDVMALYDRDSQEFQQRNVNVNVNRNAHYNYADEYNQTNKHYDYDDDDEEDEYYQD
eukprot:CAMPEP_0197041482 /NCGR_PEP_ID=MMETSP1384-20130603/18022_1 /TAXON_ID=29189 /ORGANISM="Ammonia sp." /LENGTH=182 /DNA_ID=CAMNT_0042472409 /DNA_START=30 /DNA_END=578 /DNA_ORIENTATION=-